MATAPSDGCVPCVTADQMREVDRIATETYGLRLLQMMENAGRHLAHVARDRAMNRDLRDASVLVLCGTGGNGGGGLVAARRLHGWGAAVRVGTTKPRDAFTGLPAHQLSLLERIDVPVFRASPNALPDAEVLLDAIIGYGLNGAPRGDTADLIRSVHEHDGPTLSLDVPSGFSATTARPRTPTVRADATLTLALPKCGLDAPEARAFVGRVYLADIGIPPALYDAIDGINNVTGLFSSNDIIPLD